MSVFDLLDPKKGFAIFHPKRPLISETVAYRIYNSLSSSRRRPFHNTDLLRQRHQIIDDVILRFEDFLRENVIEPLIPYEPLRFRGFTDLKTEGYGNEESGYHTDPWWMIATVAGINADPTQILRNGIRIKSNRTYQSHRFPRSFDWFRTSHSSYFIRPPVGSVIVMTGNHRQNELEIPATVHAGPSFRKGTHRVLLHKTLWRRVKV